VPICGAASAGAGRAGQVPRLAAVLRPWLKAKGQASRRGGAYARKFHYPIRNIADDILLVADTGAF
jgi:hypothetical protein